MKLNTKLLTISAVFIVALMLLTPISQINTSGGGGGADNHDLDFLNSLDINNDFVLSADQNSYSEKVSISEITSSSEGNLSIKDGNIQITTVVTVSSIDELKILSDIVNGTHINQAQQSIQSDFSGYIVVLTNDLAFAAFEPGQSNFTPIGKDSLHKFNGTFDGQGYTISNLSVNIASDSGDIHAGLFGIIGDKSTVKNLKITNSEISAISTSEYDPVRSGGIAGRNWGGTIENCSYAGTVTGSNNSGGITGLNSTDATIKNCSSAGTVTGSGILGGIAGVNYGKIENCHNTGDLNSSGIYAYSGGIAGNNSNIITNCSNTGDVSATATDDSARSGGIAGYNYMDEYYGNGTILNTFYLKSDNITGIGNEQDDGKATPLESSEMIGLKLLGGEGSTNNLNVEQDPKPWSPDIFGINNGYPILADVPLDLGNKTPQSAIYILSETEKTQAENYLELITSSVLRVEMTETAWEGNITDPKYSWYIYGNNEAQGSDAKIDVIKSNEMAVYYVIVSYTIDGVEYTYTSLTKSVGDVQSSSSSSSASSLIYYAIAAVIVILIIIALAYYFMKKKQ